MVNAYLYVMYTYLTTIYAFLLIYVDLCMIYASFLYVYISVHNLVILDVGQYITFTRQYQYTIDIIYNI